DGRARGKSNAAGTARPSQRRPAAPRWRRMAGPPPKSITSAKNPIVQRCRAAASGDDEQALLAEGVRLVTDGLDAGLRVLAALVSPRLRELALAERLRGTTREFAECSDEVLVRASALETHQGVAAVFARPQWTQDQLLAGDLSPLVVAAAGVRDPGNLGALLRTSEAAGATGFVALAGGADPFREKAVRGAMGSTFRLPTIAALRPGELLEFARQQRLQLVVADRRGDRDYLAVDWRKPTLLVVGSEAEGAPAELVAAAAARVRIPIAPKVESLNVAVAAG